MKLGIALGGGGAKGYAHVGVLEALAEEKYDFTVVTGTSIGSLIGAAYAANVLSALKETALNLRITDIPTLLSPTWSNSGFFSGKNSLELMMKLVKYENIEDLPKRYGAVSADLVSGAAINFCSGSISRAVRASIAIPGLFTPVKETEKILVDGGVLCPVPIALARQLGAEFIVAVDLFADRDLGTSTDNLLTPSREPGTMSALSYLRSIPEMIIKLAKTSTSRRFGESSLNLLGIIENTLAISQQALTKLEMKDCPPEIIIQPRVGRIGLLDFHKAEQGIRLGYEAMKEKLPELNALVLKTAGTV